jgi:biopolymer transport protein TolR
MGMAVSSGSKKKRRFGAPMSEINVTPFVDVMLVLLVIFMVTAPLMTVGVPVDLPKTNASALNEKIEPLVVSVTNEGHVFIQDTEMPLEGLVPKLQAILVGKPETQVYIRADQSVPYGRVLEVMGTLNAAGITKVSLMAELPKAVSAEPLKEKK